MIGSVLFLLIGGLFCFTAYFGWKNQNPLEGRWLQLEILKADGSGKDWRWVRTVRLVFMGIVGPALMFFGAFLVFSELGVL